MSICIVENCVNEHHATGLCKKHYDHIYLLKNKKRKAEYDRIRYLKDPEKARERVKRSRLRNLERTRNTTKRYNLRIENKFKMAIRSARDRGLTWIITLEEFKEIHRNRCIYDNKDLSLEVGSGLDRIDSTIGYKTSNVVPCCGSCNAIRNNRLSFEEMKVAMRAVLELRKKIGI